MTTAPASTVDRVARLFGFLAELQQQRTTVVRDVERYDRVVWFGDLPRDAAVANAFANAFADQSEGTDAGDGGWLTMDRTERSDPPAPPADVRPWVTDSAQHDCFRDQPELSELAEFPETVVDPDGEAREEYVVVALADHPSRAGILTAYEEWLPRWREWAVAERVRAAAIQAYHQLYAIHTDAHAMPEQYELLLCLGLATGSSGDEPVRRHLVTVAAETELDLETGRLSAHPGPGARPLLEEDMLDAADRVTGETRDLVTALLDEVDPVWPGDAAHGALRRWVHAHGANASYDPAPRRGTEPVDGLRVTFAPALVLRERTRRSFVEVFRRVADTVRETGEVPAALRNLVDLGIDRLDATEPGALDPPERETVYFPKPTNPEQREVVDRLRDSAVVAVQGPPGTGKTHTIANLITDLLAHGQRVLITSHTARALHVVKEQLPLEVQDLCVSVIDDVTRRNDQLERSVNAILDRQARWSHVEARRDRERLEDRLRWARTDRSKATQGLRGIREQETYEHRPDVGTYAGRLADIAERLRAEESAFGWIGPVPAEHPTVPTDQPRRLVDLLRRTTAEVRAGAGAVPEQPLAPAEFAELARRWRDLRDTMDEERAVRDSPLYPAVAGADPADRHVLGRAVDDLRGLLRQLQTRREPWVPDAVAQILDGRDRLLRELDAATAQTVDRTRGVREVLEGHDVTGYHALDLDTASSQAAVLGERLRAGRSLRRMGVRSKALKEAGPLFEALRVDGARCETPELLHVGATRITVERELRRVEAMWQLPPSTDQPVGYRVARLEELGGVLRQVLRLADALGAAHAIVARLPGAPILAWAHQPATAEELRAALDAVERDEFNDAIRARVEPMARNLETCLAGSDAAPPVRDALTAVRAWDAAAYERAYRRLEASRQANELLHELALVRDAVSGAAPTLARRIEQDPQNPAWAERLDRLADAWAWSVWDARVRNVADRTAEVAWQRQLDTADREERFALHGLAANLAWDQCLRRMTQGQRAHLTAFAQSVSKIGKGTGKYVRRYAREAQRHLEKCQDAVPAWVMPLHRVAETVPAQRPEVFDVAIIDEASQSGPEALLLMWLAPRVVVVGDDKQISPQDVGLDREQTHRLLDDWLHDFEITTPFQPGGSFYDLASTSGRVVRLREHFRCMPEIIGFSNHEFYRDTLVPLRQYGVDRLPPLRHTAVRTGRARGASQHLVNEREAQAVVDQVASCCADPAYADRTMGVITLQGRAQGRLIHDLLVARLGVRMMEERRLRVGHPEAFQGDERDVIFVSMVAARRDEAGEPRRVTALTAAPYQRSFNVAASRARDQAWLFHSAELDELSADDLRRRYLVYVSGPPAEQEEPDLGEVLPEVRHPSFGSLFEQRVFLDIRARGYRVWPQFLVGGHRIDLVVRGGTKCLAVECDGVDPPDRLGEDEERQGQLERVGWTFWRIRASAYYRDPKTALEPLWGLLERHGIAPAGHGGAAGPADDVRMEAASAPGPPPTNPPINPPTNPPINPPPTNEPPEAPDPDEPPTSKEAAVPDHSPLPEVAGIPGGSAGAPEPDAPTTGPEARGPTQVSSAAFTRVLREIALLTERLGQPHRFVATDGAAADAQRRHEEHMQDLYAERQRQLDRAVSTLDAGVSPGARGHAAPGCVFGLRYGAEPGIDYVVVSCFRVDEHEVVSPFSDLGRVLNGAAAGRTYSYETPAGARQVTVTSIHD